ncbi:hypothetical protein EBX93_17145 [bacterium]|nr:hypothetical protein [bacterium]
MTLFQLVEEGEATCPRENLQKIMFVNMLCVRTLGDSMKIINEGFNVTFRAEALGQGKYAVSLLPGGRVLGEVTESELGEFKHLIKGGIAV